jgi:hypothetical protein
MYKNQVLLKKIDISSGGAGGCFFSFSNGKQKFSKKYHMLDKLVFIFYN